MTASAALCACAAYVRFDCDVAALTCSSTKAEFLRAISPKIHGERASAANPSGWPRRQFVTKRSNRMVASPRNGPGNRFVRFRASKKEKFCRLTPEWSGKPSARWFRCLPLAKIQTWQTGVRRLLFVARRDRVIPNRNRRGHAMLRAAILPAGDPCVRPPCKDWQTGTLRQCRSPMPDGAARQIGRRACRHASH